MTVFQGQQAQAAGMAAHRASDSKPVTQASSGTVQVELALLGCTVGASEA